MGHTPASHGPGAYFVYAQHPLVNSQWTDRSVNALSVNSTRPFSPFLEILLVVILSGIEDRRRF